MTKKICDKLRNYSGINYCSDRNIRCLSLKYGFTEIKKYELDLPYEEKEILFYCDGVKDGN